MNWDIIEGNWKQAKGKLKEQWASSQTTTSTRSAVAGSNSAEKSRSAMAFRGTTLKSRSTNGKTRRATTGFIKPQTSLAGARASRTSAAHEPRLIEPSVRLRYAQQTGRVALNRRRTLPAIR